MKGTGSWAELRAGGGQLFRQLTWAERTMMVQSSVKLGWVPPHPLQTSFETTGLEQTEFRML